MRGFLLSALLALCLSGSAAAAPHRVRIYPNASITILAIAEGRDGFLWLAAADGLYRFDGLHYQRIPDYPFLSARFVGVTSDGSIWAGDYEGLARLRNGKFEIVLRQGVLSVAAYSDRIFVRLVGSDLVQVRLDGAVTYLHNPPRRDMDIDAYGRLWGVCLGPEQSCWIDPLHPEQVHYLPLPARYQEAAPDAAGNVWAATDTHADLIQNGRVVRVMQRKATRDTTRHGPLLAGRNGQLWFLGESISGLSPHVSFRDRTDAERFSPLAGFEDARGHFWVASAGRGLAEWIPDSQWQRWFSEDFSHEVLDLQIHDPHGSVVLATHKNLYRLDDSSQKWSPLATEERRYDGLIPWPDGGFLASIRNFGLARLAADGRVLEHLKDLAPDEEYRKILRDGRGRIWVGTRRKLLRVAGNPGSLHFEEQRLPGVQPSELEQAVDLELDGNGDPWVGYMRGIARLDETNRWSQIATDRPVTMVRSFALAGDDIWVAHRRTGAFSHLHRNGDRWNVTERSASNGYTPADTDFIKKDSRGWIWRGTPEGVLVCDGANCGPDDWLHLNVGNGLASDDSNQYGFLEDPDGSVWLTAEQGVTHILPDASWFAAPASVPAPQVTRMEADGKDFAFPEKAPALPADTKVLQLEAGTLGTPPFRDAPLRYRLRPLATDWSLSNDGTFEFHNLPRNSYTLEVGYTGGGSSPVGTFSFSIGSSPGVLGNLHFPWLWLGWTLLAMAVLIPAFRFLPALEGPRFHIEKGLFLLRRRLNPRRSNSPSGGMEAAPDYRGETMRERYLLDRVISRGGFSVVYEASDLHAHDVQKEAARCAVKVLTGSSSIGGWVRDRFAHEVAALRSIHHPNVVSILDSWISRAGEPCIAMPFLDGPTLRGVLSRSPLHAARVARIVEQLGEGLAAAHARGIVHRDLKPENIILLEPGTAREAPVIVDFGTAGLRGAEFELAATTLMAGSFLYMAPERLTGHYSPASDVYSLGVMILEMLTGKRLSDLGALSSDPAFQREMELLLRENPGPLAAVPLASALTAAFHSDPRKRPSNVRQWSVEIAALLAA